MSKLLARAALGGVLMGLANLVPGISGGTMLLAAGVYPLFVGAVAEMSTLRFRRRSMALLATVVICAMAAVLLLAGSVKDLVVDHRWVMYSLFAGLTLGGLPVVWQMARPADRRVSFGAIGGFLGMTTLALAQTQGVSPGAGTASWPLFFVAGLAGASAMILPGVSGGYLLLVLGMYLPILGGIDAFKEALGARDLGAVGQVGVEVILPVALGVVVGVVAVSNAIRWLLARYEKATLGVLVGLLLGAVVGLWPFQEAVAPTVGETVIHGEVLTAEAMAELEAEDYPTAYFSPGALQVAGAVGFALLGLLITTLVARLGEEPNRE
jgi:putative membrane protein